MWSEQALRRTGLAAALVVALATTQAPGKPPAGPAVALDVFTTTAHDVTELRREGASPVCRLRAAIWEPQRPDSGRFPAPVLGERTGLFGDRWLDISQWDTLGPLLSDRVRLCREKGFDTIRFDDDWGHPGGLDLNAADWERFADRMSTLAAGHGLAVEQGRPAKVQT